MLIGVSFRTKLLHETDDGSRGNSPNGDRDAWEGVILPYSFCNGEKRGAFAR